MKYFHGFYTPEELSPHKLSERMGQYRGVITDRVNKRSIELLGYEVGECGLRLMPYILSTMMDSQRLDPEKMEGREFDILLKWELEGHIKNIDFRICITHKFWYICAELVFLAYVDR